MKSMKIRTDIAKQAWHILRDVAAKAASTPDLNLDVISKAKDMIMDVFKPRKKRHNSGIMIYSSPSLVDNMKLNPPTPSDNISLDHHGLVLHDSSKDGEENSVSCLLMQRIDEDCSSIIKVEEIDELADAFIAGFHHKIRLEKQQSYRSYQDMLSRGT
eukprot:Gb_08823 [translate_table: standard]